MSAELQPTLEAWIKDKGAPESAPYLSVVIPAYNEYRRLPVTLMEMIDYLDRQAAGSELPSYEIIVVDDGSSDETSEIVRKFEKIRPQVKLFRLARNFGKGHAVRTGMMNAQGKVIMFADADGATPFPEVEKLLSLLKAGNEVVIASRAKISADTKIETVWYRKYLGRIFNFLVNTVLLPGIADTQCGFKMFNARAAHFIFPRQTAERFSFDVEVLFIARRAGLSISEVAVNWHNVPGSKVNLITDSLRMLRDIFIFSMRHRTLSPKDYLDFNP